MQHLPMMPSKCNITVGMTYHADVVVVGAGPAGLQWALLAGQAGIDYVVLEQAAGPGAFFGRYPRGRRLISHNKCRSGGRSADYALRHDWHSLLNASHSMCTVTADYYPQAQQMVRYLSDIAVGLRVQYQSQVVGLELAPTVRRGAQPRVHIVRLLGGRTWTCKHLVLATGLQPKPVPAAWAAFGESYSYGDFPALDASHRAPFCDDKEVVVIGTGNAAFETADLLRGCASGVHVWGRRPKFSALSHYPGALRLQNMGLVDRYLLKSVDSFYARPQSKVMNMTEEMVATARRELGNVTIFCGGFTAKRSGLVEDMSEETNGRFPRLGAMYAIPRASNGWYAGSVMHAADYRQSAGGFVHGFRYLVRAQTRFIFARDFGVRWPAYTVIKPGGRMGAQDAAQLALTRVQNSSGLYQMQGRSGLVDVILPTKDAFFFLEEVPRLFVDEVLRVVAPLELTQRRCELRFAYGPLEVAEGVAWTFDGGNGPWTFDRLWDTSLEDQKPSLFLHPVFESVGALKNMGGSEKRKRRVFEASEDITTTWTGPKFVEEVLDCAMKCLLAGDE
mmetsp:Transcript_22014/g.36369  ORF Transcript_22014/g.36369 Transcript_22014/m.36369 type:complete len:561 (+) Transcript_22014:36-1718(+)